MDGHKVLKEMSVHEVINTTLFINNLSEVIDYLKRVRKKARKELMPPLKSLPIDRLTDQGDFVAWKVAVMYENIINKELKGYSATERQFIFAVGNEAYNKTIKTLLENEKKRNNADGHNDK